MDWPLGFGVFLAPFHPAGQNPTLALQRDLELIGRLDELGYDEAWIGEHHSAGAEIIARTRGLHRRRSRTHAPHPPRHRGGIASLPPPLPRCRPHGLPRPPDAGPGALPSDAAMLGIEPDRQRTMMEEALEAIVLLFTSDAPVTYESDWFTLRDACLQLRPYQRPCLELAVANAPCSHGTGPLPTATASP